MIFTIIMYIPIFIHMKYSELKLFFPLRCSKNFHTHRLRFSGGIQETRQGQGCQGSKGWQRWQRDQGELADGIGSPPHFARKFMLVDAKKVSMQQFPLPQNVDPKNHPVRLIPR